MEDLAATLDVKLELRDRALAIAAATVDKRLEGMNELRQQIDSERGHYVTREVFDIHAARTAALESRVARIEGGGKAGDQLTSWIIAGVGTGIAGLIAIAAIVLTRI
jgi:hypothetical protein